MPGSRVKVPLRGHHPRRVAHRAGRRVRGAALAQARQGGLLRAHRDARGLRADPRRRGPLRRAPGRTSARLAIPPRHAATEKAPQRDWPEPTAARSRPRCCPAYPDGQALLEALAGRAARRGCCGRSAAVFGGAGRPDRWGDRRRSTPPCAPAVPPLVVVPTMRELAVAARPLPHVFGHGAVGTLAAESGRSARYRAFLAALRGEARIMVGTRSAVYAPCVTSGCWWWSTTATTPTPSLAPPIRTPGPSPSSAAARQGPALLIAGHGRSTDAQALVERGWLRDLSLPPAQARRVSTPVRAVAEEDRERDPSAARLRIPSGGLPLPPRPSRAGARARAGADERATRGR